MKIRHFLTLAALAPTICAAVDWPNYLGPEWNGTTSESPGRGAPKKLWEKNVGMGCGSFATKAGVVLVMGNDGNGTTITYCLKADSGEKIWEHTFGSESTKGFKADYDQELFDKFHCWNHPVVSNGKLFVKDVKGNVIAMGVK